MKKQKHKRIHDCKNIEYCYTKKTPLRPLIQIHTNKKCNSEGDGANGERSCNLHTEKDHRYIHECSDQNGTTVDPPEVLHAHVPPCSSVSNCCSSNPVVYIMHTIYQIPTQQGELEECSVQNSDDVIRN